MTTPWAAQPANDTDADLRDATPVTATVPPDEVTLEAAAAPMPDALIVSDARATALDDAVAQHPGVAVNYVLRAEHALAQGRPAAASADFRRALALAQAEVSARPWGLVAQTLADRALTGLRRALGTSHDHEGMDGGL